MSNQRADLGFGTELDSFDPNGWGQKPKAKPKAKATEAAAEAAGFKSREPAPEKPKAPTRRRTTGRNQQINIKAKAETIEAFYALADANGWVLGEGFEHAVELLEKKYGKKQ